MNRRISKLLRRLAVDKEHYKKLKKGWSGAPLEEKRMALWMLLNPEKVQAIMEARENEGN